MSINNINKYYFSFKIVPMCNNFTLFVHRNTKQYTNIQLNNNK